MTGRRVRAQRPASRRRYGAAIASALIASAAATAAASPTISPRGRFQLDVVTFAGADDAELADGFHNRRTRLGASGRLDDDWDYQLEVDLAEELVGARSIHLRRALPAGRLTLGQFKVPMSLSQLTSSNDITFLERSSAATLIPDGFRLGAGYSYFGAIFGLESMIFGRAIGDEVTGDMPLGFASRGVAAPALGGGRLHLGLSAALEHRRDETELQFRDRPEARGPGGGTRLIDTGPFEARRTAKVGVELAYLRGPFSAEAEYLAAYVDRAGADDLLADGAHVQVSYVITGESRAYANGVFGSPTPKGRGGAWELAARLSRADLDRTELAGGVQRTLTLGANWYASENIRIMINNIVAVIDDGPLGDQTLNIAACRLQYHF